MNPFRSDQKYGGITFPQPFAMRWFGYAIMGMIYPIIMTLFYKSNYLLTAFSVVVYHLVWWFMTGIRYLLWFWRNRGSH